jgi:separase
MSLTGTPVAPSRERSRRAIMFDAETSEDEEESPNKSLKDYWRGVRDRYRFESVDLASLATSQVDQLPTNWTFISITVTEDRNTMILSRQRSHREPLVFCLPLDRQGRRDGNDEHFTFIDAIQELDSIIRDSNSTALGAKNVKGHDQKVQWWETRRALDKRLGELLSNIEFCWLGVFKVGNTRFPLS